jgi:hypothetical protein
MLRSIRKIQRPWREIASGLFFGESLMSAEPLEKQMWCAVVQIAWDDYFAKRPSWKQGIRDWEKNRREARLFLTKNGGEWRRSREDVCSAAGIDPDALRDRFLVEEHARAAA